MSRRSNGAPQTPRFSHTRRSLLIVAGGLWIPDAFAAQGRGLVDVHHHWSNAQLLQWWGRSAGAQDWSADKALSAMDQAGVSAAMLSITQPGVWKSTDAEASVKLARACNESMARITQDHPRRFGFLATVALPMVRASIAEVGYSLDALKADGVGLLSSYDGKYLGDADFIPLFEELNHRRAIVYVHPAVPGCCANLVPQVAATAFEAPTDTTRTIESLLFAGALTRFSAIRFIFAHGGGSLPYLADRIVSAIGPSSGAGAERNDLTPYKARTALAQLYFDSASVANPAAWAALTTFTTADRILFGSDYPAHTMNAALGAVRAMEQRFGMAPADSQSIEYGNAQQLFAARFV
jgi:predicted TIM-barrel fold metal-dependent hydrolase